MKVMGWKGEMCQRGAKRIEEERSGEERRGERGEEEETVKSDKRKGSRERVRRIRRVMEGVRIQIYLAVQYLLPTLNTLIYDIVYIYLHQRR